MIFRNSAFSHIGCDHRNLIFFRKTNQCFFCFCKTYTTAHDDKRIFSLRKHLYRFFNFFRIRHYFINFFRFVGLYIKFQFPHLHIQREVYQYRAGLSFSHQIKSFSHHFRYFFGFHRTEHLLCNSISNAYHINTLERILTQLPCIGLSYNCQKRNGINIGCI